MICGICAAELVESEQLICAMCAAQLVSVWTDDLYVASLPQSLNLKR